MQNWIVQVGYLSQKDFNKNIFSHTSTSVAKTSDIAVAPTAHLMKLPVTTPGYCSVHGELYNNSSPVVTFMY